MILKEGKSTYNNRKTPDWDDKNRGAGWVEAKSSGCELRVCERELYERSRAGNRRSSRSMTYPGNTHLPRCLRWWSRWWSDWQQLPRWLPLRYQQQPPRSPAETWERISQSTSAVMKKKKKVYILDRGRTPQVSSALWKKLDSSGESYKCPTFFDSLHADSRFTPKKITCMWAVSVLKGLLVRVQKSHEEWFQEFALRDELQNFYKIR